MKQEQKNNEILNGRVQLALLIRDNKISLGVVVLVCVLFLILTFVGCYATHGFGIGDTSVCQFQGRTASIEATEEKCRPAGKWFICSPE